MKWAWGKSMRSGVPSGGQGATPRSAQAIWIKPFQKPPAAPPSLLPCPDPASLTAVRPSGCGRPRIVPTQRG